MIDDLMLPCFAVAPSGASKTAIYNLLRQYKLKDSKYLVAGVISQSIPTMSP